MIQLLTAMQRLGSIKNMLIEFGKKDDPPFSQDTLVAEIPIFEGDILLRFMTKDACVADLTILEPGKATFQIMDTLEGHGMPLKELLWKIGLLLIGDGAEGDTDPIYNMQNYMLTNVQLTSTEVVFNVFDAVTRRGGLYSISITDRVVITKAKAPKFPSDILTAKESS